MLPYFVHELPCHPPVFRAELPSLVLNSVTSRLPEQTYLLDTFLQGFNISSIQNLIQSLTLKYVHLGYQSYSFRSGSTKRVHLSIRVIACSNIARSSLVMVFHLDSIAGQIPCRGVSGSPTGLELLTPVAVALRIPSRDEYCPMLDDGNVGGQ